MFYLTSKKVLTNISFSMIAHGALFMFPLLSLPILTRSLGLEGYGKLAITLAIANIFSIFIDFGLPVSAARQIASKNLNEDISRIYWQTQLSKLLLTSTFAIPFILGTAIIIDNSDLQNGIFLAMLCSSLNNILFSNWFLEGQQRFVLVSSILIFCKTIQLILLIIFVSTPNDYYTALIIELSFGTIAGILVSSAIYKEISSIKKSDLKNVFIQLKNAYPFFVMNITINLYTSMNTLILGIFATANIVGTYAIAEKIIVACKRILQPISTVLFHRLINSLKENTYFIKVMLMTLIYFAFGIVMAAILLFYGDSIIYLIYGKPLHKTEQLLAIMCAVPLLTYLSNIFAINVLIIHHKERLLMNITIFSGFFGILICYFLTMFFQEIGTAISLVSTELCVLIMSLFFSKAILFNKGLKQC